MNYGKYFKESEFVCSHTGNVAMQQSFVDQLNVLRETYGKPLRITSGYRDPTHPIEAKKKKVENGIQAFGWQSENKTASNLKIDIWDLFGMRVCKF